MVVETVEGAAYSELRRLLRLDLRDAERMTPDVLRYAVDLYYTLQKQRIILCQQADAIEQGTLISRMAQVFQGLEEEMRYALERYLDDPVEEWHREAGHWSLRIRGIGPVLAAALFAHVNMERCPYVSSLWRFAGLDPTARWGKGQRRPWNAKLKTICWRIGDSFVKTSGVCVKDGRVLELNEIPENALYCWLYVTKKEEQKQKNEAGAFAEQAAEALSSGRFSRDTKTRAAYEAGRLPDGRIHLRAQRYAVKMFLSHWWQVAYESFHGKPAPDPWVISIGGHQRLIPVPCRDQGSERADSDEMLP